MKEIKINKELKKYDIDTKKVRIISIRDSKILTCIYDGIYMLPGGKIDENETELDALKRELYEETGNILGYEPKNFLRIINSQEKYLSRDRVSYSSKRINTLYYLLDTPIAVKRMSLSEKERNSNFEIVYIDIQQLIIILENVADEKGKVFAHELLIVLKEYLNTLPFIDLHTHTIYSDGEHTPDEIIKMAENKNVSDIAITDHDTILGLKNIDYESHKNINIIPGVEISVKVSKGRMHILGLNIDYKSEALIKFLNTLKKNNIQNLTNIIDYLKSIGIKFVQEDVEEIFSHTGNIGRPDVAKLLIKYGYVKSVKEAFDKYLVEAFDMVHDRYQGYNYYDVLKAITEANGIPILAHPNSLELSNEEFENLLIDMIDKGLMGLEVFHPNMSNNERIFYMDMVNKYNLLYSGGSDYHGEHVKPDIEIATGNNNLSIHNASVLRYIKKESH